MKKRYILIALIASVVGNAEAQNSPISGGYTISALLTDSGNVYWAGGFGGGAGSFSSGNVFKKVLRGAQPDDPLKPSPFLKKIVLMNSNSGNHILAKDCDYVYAFGGGGNGQLGDGNTNTTDIPVRVLKGAQSPNVSGFLENVIGISTGNLSSYAVISDGRVMAWGENASGRLGDGTTVDKLTPVYVKQQVGAVISDLTNVIQVTGLENAAAALKADGTVWAWGSGGQSETANVGTSSYAMQVTGFPAGTKIVKIEGGDFNVLSLDDQGYLWNWGRGNTGSMGDGKGANSTIPVKVIDVGATFPTTLYLKDVVDMAGGQTIMLALLKSGKVAYWGPDGTPSNPKYVQNPTNTGDLTDIAYIGTGDNHGLAMKADGTLYTWRENGSGQLGLGNTTDRTFPTEVLPRPYKIKLPCPSAYLGPDVTLCNPLSANLYAGSQSPTFKYRWYKDGVLVSDSAANYATGAYYTANAPGTYKVVITDTSEVFNCTPCLPAEDEVIITTSSVAPINGTFCSPSGSTTLGVNDPGSTFDWYAASTGGSVLSGGSGTNTYVTPTLSATTTYYVQDTRTYTYNNASTYAYYPTQSGLAAPTDACVSNTHIQSRAAFTVQQTLTLVSVDIFKFSACAASGGIRNEQLKLDLLTAPGGAIVSSQTIDVTIICETLNTVPINLTLAPGHYRLGWNTSFCNVRYFQNAVYPTGVAGLISFYDADAGNFGVWTSTFFNWNISAQQNCGRIPVQAIANSCPLPVNFHSFKAEKIKQHVRLNWNTIEQGENHFFEIERSVDGRVFEVVGKVDAKSFSYSSYSFIDQLVPTGVLYYRIKQYDKDGSFIYSGIRQVTDMAAFDVAVFPNPTENNFNLSISDFTNSEFKGEVYSSIGTMAETFNGTTNNSIHFGNNLSSGCYVLKLMVGNDAPRMLKICKR